MAVVEQICEVNRVRVTGLVRSSPSAWIRAGEIALIDARPRASSQTPRLPTYATSRDMSLKSWRCSEMFHWSMREGRPPLRSRYCADHAGAALSDPDAGATPGFRVAV